MEIEGMIIRDLGQFEGVSKAGNPWKKHEWVLETIGQFPRNVKFTVFGDRTNTITFELGKTYNIQVDVESREFNERWYTDLTAYAARLVEAGTSVQSVPQASQAAPANPYAQASAPTFSQPSSNPFGEQKPEFSQGGAEEDLPF